MSNKLQSLDSIEAIGGNPRQESQDAVKKEYNDGLQFLEKQEFGQAALAFHNALLGFEERQDEAGIANASNQIGHLCLSRKDYEGALKHYERALLICDKLNDRMSSLAVLQKIVAARKGLKKYDEAIAASMKMLDLYQDNRDPQGSVTTLEEIAEIYLEAGKKEKAAGTYKVIGSIHKNFQHDSIAAKYMEKAAQLAQVVD
ncbi:MAG: tetratricopeptide repeat protein [Desulforhopalus sp.]|nr:tetratricopeptide repeat protein [Desulforhopalus sp.]